VFSGALKTENDRDQWANWWSALGPGATRGRGKGRGIERERARVSELGRAAQEGRGSRRRLPRSRVRRAGRRVAGVLLVEPGDGDGDGDGGGWVMGGGDVWRADDFTAMRCPGPRSKNAPRP
jgi:hypothetical protein